jgi:xanthine dehydrogenase large subunit
MNKHASRDLTAAKIAGGVAEDLRHDSARKHVTG